MSLGRRSGVPGYGTLAQALPSGKTLADFSASNLATKSEGPPLDEKSRSAEFPLRGPLTVQTSFRDGGGSEHMVAPSGPSYPRTSTMGKGDRLPSPPIGDLDLTKATRMIGIVVETSPGTGFSRLGRDGFRWRRSKGKSGSSRQGRSRNLLKEVATAAFHRLARNLGCDERIGRRRKEENRSQQESSHSGGSLVDARGLSGNAFMFFFPLVLSLECSTMM